MEHTRRKSAEEIQKLIVQSTGDIFADRELREDLNVTIRIACDFYDFLSKAGDLPDVAEADYIVGTIRSGIDHFFSLAHLSNTVDSLDLQKGFELDAPRQFSEMKSSYSSVFHELVRDDLSAPRRLGFLLALVRLMMLFMAIQFPEGARNGPSTARR